LNAPFQSRRRAVAPAAVWWNVMMLDSTAPRWAAQQGRRRARDRSGKYDRAQSVSAADFRAVAFLVLQHCNCAEVCIQHVLRAGREATKRKLQPRVVRVPELRVRSTREHLQHFADFS